MILSPDSDVVLTNKERMVVLDNDRATAQAKWNGSMRESPSPRGLNSD